MTDEDDPDSDDANEGKKDYSSTVTKVGKDHWRRTYKADGLTADLKASWHSFWMDLTNVEMARGLNMEVKETGFLSREDKYEERQSLRAIGTLDNVALEYIDREENDYTKFTRIGVTITFERAWADPPHPKMKWVDGDGNEHPVGDEYDEDDDLDLDEEDLDELGSVDSAEAEPAAEPETPAEPVTIDFAKMFSGKHVETGEYWSLGECQRGSLDPQTGRYSRLEEGDPELHLHLKMPRDFLPTLEKALNEPERAAGVRMGFYLRCYEEGVQAAFSEPFQYQEFMIERDKSAPAYLSAFTLISNITAPVAQPKQPEDEAKGWLRKSSPAPAPAVAQPKLDELITWVKYGVFALAGVAAILLARLD